MILIFVIIAFILASVVQYLLMRRGVSGINADVYPEADSLEPGETFVLNVSVENSSRAFFPYVRYRVILPQEIEVATALSVSEYHKSSISVSGTMILPPRRKVTRQIYATCKKRGAHRFGDIYIQTGDFLGIAESGKNFYHFRQIAVYPKACPQKSAEVTYSNIMGDHSVRRFIYEDPVLISGFRSYSGREPMKDISWLASARTGELMVKTYDHTASPSVTVVLDCQGFSEEVIELCLSTARTILEELEREGIEYDFILDSSCGGSNCGQHYFSKGMGLHHLHGILRQMAFAEYFCSYSAREMAEKLMSEVRDLSGIIFITGARSESSDAACAVFRRNPALQIRTVYAQENAACM